MFKHIWTLHQHHWNWLLLTSGLVVMFISLWNHSIWLMLVAFCFWGGACIRLPDPEPPFRFVERCLFYERKWVYSKWDSRKILRFSIFLILAAVIVFAVWKNSYISLLLFAGIGMNGWCVYANKKAGVDKP